MTRTITLKETQAAYAPVIAQVQATGESLIVEQDGKPTVVVVPFAEYQQLVARRESEQKNARQAEQEALLREEFAAFEQLKPELLKTHLGKWVAILKGRLIDTDDDRRALSKRMRTEFGNRVMLIEQVLVEPRVYIVDSPEQVGA